MSEAKTTTDHDEIKRWVEARGGRPSLVRETEDGERGGVLRFDFGEREADFDDISWDRFFDVFDERELALLHQDETSEGKQSRFSRFVKREDA